MNIDTIQKNLKGSKIDFLFENTYHNIFRIVELIFISSLFNIIINTTATHLLMFTKIILLCFWDRTYDYFHFYFFVISFLFSLNVIMIPHSPFTSSYNGAWRWSLGNLYVAAYWRARIFGPSGFIYRPSDCMYVCTIPLYGCTVRRSC